MYIQPRTLLARYEAALRDNPNITITAFAMMNGMTDAVCLARLDTGRKEREIAGRVEYSLGQPLKLTGDWMIAGDIHVPYTDYDYAALLAMIAKKHMKRPRRLLLAGDFFNMDTFSTYAHLTNIPTWAQERDAARGLIDAWLGTFDEIVAIMGNHDRRLQKFTGGAFDETDIFGMVKANPDKLKPSNFGWCTVDTITGIWRVTHPRNYSINQLGVAEAIAQKHGQHVISFHEHHLGIGWDRYKRHCIVNGGCLVDPGKLAYAVLDDSRSAGMAHGFVMLRAGTPYLFGDAPITDWSRWL